jgi:anti-anti-sigma factor
MERQSALLPFVRAGLEKDEKVLYIAGDDHRAEIVEAFRRAGDDVADALDDGRIEVTEASEKYLADGAFARGQIIRNLRGEIETTRAQGFRRVRIAGEMDWALDSDTDPNELIAYEEQVDELLRETDTAALCQYDRTLFDAVTRRAAEQIHHLVLAERNRDGGAPCELLVERGPEGETVLRGEADGLSCASLERSLQAAIARSDEIRLDLSDLSFVSAAALRAIRNAGKTLDRRGGHLTLVSPRPVVRHVVTLMGFSGNIAIEDVA